MVLLAAASYDGLPGCPATEWRDVAIGEIPEAIVYRNPQGTFTRSVTATSDCCRSDHADRARWNPRCAPFYGVAVFLPITVMGLRSASISTITIPARSKNGTQARLSPQYLQRTVFVGQIAGKWSEGGWVRLITFTTLFLAAHLLLISPLGYRNPPQIHRASCAIRHVCGAMASIVEWQSLKMQEYRYLRHWRG